MPQVLATAATRTRRHLLGLTAAALLLAACSGTQVQSGATGTKIEAKQVVALVYAQAPDAEIDKLLYSGGDLTRAIKRLRDRFPQLKPWLEDGAIGNTASGFVALRDPARREQLRELIRIENRDRTFLYREASDVVGHGDQDLESWLPYASFTFGSEWIGQGPSGWWWQNEHGQWRQK